MSKDNLTDEKIVARIEQEESLAYGINDSELSADRAKAIKYYLGEPFGNEVEGRSQVVSYDVQDTIESALPQLIKVFVSGDQVVQFEPRGPEDQEASEQETEYINHVVMEKNPGFRIFYVWFKDALLSKNGYVKAWYEEEYEEEEESYRGLTDAQLQMLASAGDVEVMEHTAYPDPSFPSQPDPMAQALGQVPMPPMLHDVKIKITNKSGCIKIRNVAPENMKVSVDCDSSQLHHARFVQHSEMMPISELKEQGFDVPDDLGFTDNMTFEVESLARDIYEEQANRVEEYDEVLVRDTYIRIDGERWRYVVVGTTIIHKEKVECIPFACLSPMLMPHRHIGRSYADLTMDIQLIKSTLIRGQLDNMYLSNNGRYAINSDRVNLEDLLVSRPGGVVRVKGSPAMEIAPLQHAPFPPTSFTMVEYMDSAKEKRTGVTAYNQGMDSNSLNKTATGVQQIMSAAQQRLELVARVFAETGVKDLFTLVHRLVRMNYTKPDIVRLRNKWVEVDPREWKNRNDMTISVGLGTGNKDQQLSHLMNILGVQQQGLAIGITSPEKIYNAVSKLTQNAGFKNADEFWTNPSQNPPQQQQPDPRAMAEMQKQQNEQAKMQQQAQLDNERLALDKQKAEQDFFLGMQKLVMDQKAASDKAMLEMTKMFEEVKLENAKLIEKAYSGERQYQTQIDGGINAQ